jgi:hypothetical protein
MPAKERRGWFAPYTSHLIKGRGRIRAVNAAT